MGDAAGEATGEAEGEAAGALAAAVATPSVLGSKAAKPDEMVFMPPFQSGLMFTSLSKLHMAAPPQLRLHFGFSHFPGWHFQVH